MTSILPVVSQAMSVSPSLSVGEPPGTVSAPQALATDLSAFEKAADTAIRNVQAAPIQQEGPLAAHLAASMQDLSSHLSGWQKAHVPAATQPIAPSASVSPSLTSSMADAVASMQGAYVFAIETTLASRGSTELTKVFNTLLKGQ